MSHQDSTSSTATASATDPRSTPSAAISSDSPSAFDAAANKTRRSHRKSRNGCAECKRRHIRCDEHRPVCSNCVSADRACVFPRPPATGTSAPTPNGGVSKPATSTTNGSRRRHHVAAADAAATPPHQLPSPCAAANTPSPRPGMPWEECSGPLPRPNPSTASYSFRRSNYVYKPSTTSSMDTTTASAAPPTPHASLDPDLSASASIYTPFHLQLFHHINTVMLPDPGVNTSNHLNHFPTNPFITNLRHQATELQTRAVANFTRLTAHLPPDDTASCIPRFLFSSTLSMHSLADSLAELRAANSDFHGFIDRFVDCFNLYRGIRAVIYPTWQFLSDSELRPLLEVTREANLGIVERGHECAPLHDLLRHSDLAPASLEACRVAVDKLQWAFDLHNNLPPGSGQHAVSAFSVIVSAEYVDVLRKHRPEALIILSYFAVLLHRCRHFWIFQNSGACMIRAIANHIGSYWRDAMAWPLQVIETEDC
ncbi:Lysine biosynthesis regulatory protein LYS14 [Beauveria bassiana]|uniref:Lysine biosynthesis regulatory protein LYS14 n=1 Tax=Beauveria bassiana TaxID=176275 RepID=A0A2N6NWT3_BEABA|nr:Lysine biosynthesis regulatory protein LYS14 [Beauveria bassiana]